VQKKIKMLRNSYKAIQELLIGPRDAVTDNSKDDFTTVHPA